MLIRRLAVMLLAALTVVGGCVASPDTTGPLPDGRRLVEDAARAWRDVGSVHFDFHVSGAIPGLPVRQVEGVATRAGKPYGFARGRAEVQRITEQHRYRFVLDGRNLRLTETDGEATRERAVPTLLTPARLLDPDKGLGTLLTQATALETETREELDGVAAYRVNGKLSRAALAGFIPRVHTDVDVKFWIAAEGRGHLMRVWVQVPPQQQNEGAVMLELALDEHNSPVRRSRTSETAREN